MAAKSRTNGRKKNGMVKLKIVVEKLQKSLSQAMKPSSDFYNPNQGYEEVCDDSPSVVPEDVKEGHFAVMVVGEGQPKRYVVALSYLTHPAFLRLLEQAVEEYGFDHEGALTIPCRSSELDSILTEECSYDYVGWDSCDEELLRTNCC